MPEEYKETYEKAPGKMTSEEFKIATVGLLNSIVERLDTMNGDVKQVRTHKVYFRVIGWVSGMVLLPVLVWLIISSMGT